MNKALNDHVGTSVLAETRLDSGLHSMGILGSINETSQITTVLVHKTILLVDNGEEGIVSVEQGKSQFRRLERGRILLAVDMDIDIRLRRRRHSISREGNQILRHLQQILSARSKILPSLLSKGNSSHRLCLHRLRYVLQD